MKIELGKIVNSVEILRKLSQQDLPVKLGFRLLSLTKSLDEKLKTFEEARINLIKKYGVEDEAGNVTVTQENLETFSDDLNELLAEEVFIEFTKIPVDAFPATITLTVAELASIDWMIEV